MTYDPNDPNRMRDQYGNYDGPHWGWYAAIFGLVIMGMIVFVASDGDTTRTAMNGNPSTSAPATTGSAPITEGAPNRGGSVR